MVLNLLWFCLHENVDLLISIICIRLFLSRILKLIFPLRLLGGTGKCLDGGKPWRFIVLSRILKLIFPLRLLGGTGNCLDGGKSWRFIVRESKQGIRGYDDASHVWFESFNHRW